MKEELFLEGIDLLMEETALLILKRNLLGDAVFTGAINSAKSKKYNQLDKLPKPIIDKIINSLQDNNPEVDDFNSLKKFIEKSDNSVKFSMMGKTFRLVSDGRSK